MTTQKIFIRETNGERIAVGSSMSTTYSYDASTMTLKVFWKRGEPVVLENVAEDEPIWVNCRGGVPEVKRIKLPRREADCLAWLLDFPKAVRAHSKEEYTNLLEIQRGSYGWWGYLGYSRTGNGWAIALSYRPDCGDVHRIACFISDEAATDKGAVKDMLKVWSELRRMYYPKAFVSKVLRNIFGFTENDLEDVDDYIGG